MRLALIPITYAIGVALAAANAGWTGVGLFSAGAIFTALVALVIFGMLEDG